MARFLLIPVLMTCMAILTGCGGEKKYPVSGKVNFDSAPLDSGTILFVESAGKGQPEAALIKDGVYSIVLSPATYKVQITAEKMVPTSPAERKAGAADELMRQILPAKYSGEKTELSATVENKSAQTFNFELKSGK